MSESDDKNKPLQEPIWDRPLGESMDRMVFSEAELEEASMEIWGVPFSELTEPEAIDEVKQCVALNRSPKWTGYLWSHNHRN